MKLLFLTILASLVACSDLKVDRTANVGEAPHHDVLIETIVGEKGIEKLKEFILFDSTGTFTKQAFEWATANNNEEILDYIKGLEDESPMESSSDTTSVINRADRIIVSDDEQDFSLGDHDKESAVPYPSSESETLSAQEDGQIVEASQEDAETVDVTIVKNPLYEARAENAVEHDREGSDEENDRDGTDEENDRDGSDEDNENESGSDNGEASSNEGDNNGTGSQEVSDDNEEDQTSSESYDGSVNGSSSEEEIHLAQERNDFRPFGRLPANFFTIILILLLARLIDLWFQFSASGEFPIVGTFVD